jgi:hypothetical protein
MRTAFRALPRSTSTMTTTSVTNMQAALSAASALFSRASIAPRSSVLRASARSWVSTRIMNRAAGMPLPLTSPPTRQMRVASSAKTS